MNARTSALLVLAAAAAAAAAAVAPAQTSFAPYTVKQHLPARHDHSRGAVLEDLDGDGDLDAVFANSRERHGMYENIGHGRFVDVSTDRLPDASDDPATVVAVDLDGDGDLDLVFVNGYRGFRQQNRVYVNDGSGRFRDATATALPVQTEGSLAAAVTDVDGDDDLDLFVANSFGDPDRLYLNDGSGSFTDVTATHLPDTSAGSTAAVVFEDVDGDRDADLLLAHTATTFRRVLQYRNDGSGRFQDATAGNMPDSLVASALAVGDVDGDGDPDCVAGDRLLSGDGGGRFVLAPFTRIPRGSGPTNAVALTDLDGDSDLDLLRGIGSTADPRPNRVDLNDGSGQFAAAPAAGPSEHEATIGIAVGDVDGDGDRDWVAANAGLHGGVQNRLHLNDGAGVFVAANVDALPPDGESSFGVAVGDLNADGSPDIVFANVGVGLTNRLGPARQYRRDFARGAFVDVSEATMPADAIASEDVALADVDGDGDLDIALARSGILADLLLINDGTGRFADETDARLPAERGSTRAVVFVDVDGDLDPDLLVSRQGAPDRLLQNDGNGFFTDVTTTHMPTAPWITSELAAGDVDNDGDQDLIVANARLLPPSERGNRLYLNDGAGRYTDATLGRLPPDTSSTLSAVLGDVDGDGDQDLVCGNAGQNLLYLNDGSGTFTDVTATHLPADSDTTNAVALADVDGDGDLDLATGNGLTRRTRLHLNDGSGRFTDRTSELLPEDADHTNDLAIADLDEDGSLDLITANGTRNFPEPNRNFVGLAQQIAAPWHPAVGTDYRIELFAEPGRLDAFRVAIPVLAPLRGRVPLPPFGVFGLDPATTALLDPVYIPPQVGRASIGLAVPAEPSLAGAAVHFQAAFLSPRNPARLSNVLDERILR